MKAVVSVIGKDRTGIIAAVAGELAECKVNIEDITQTLMQGNFVMIMLVDLSAACVSQAELGERLRVLSEPLGVTIHVQNSELFAAMHRV